MDINWGVSQSNTVQTDSLSEKSNKGVPVSDMIYSYGREIHFTAGINGYTIEKLIQLFSKVIFENTPQYGVKLKEGETINIKYIVDSPGGSVTAVLKFVDFLNMIKQNHPYFKFTSVITGLVASAGTIMAIVADERLMTPNAFAMIHELSSGSSGKYKDIMEYSKFLRGMHTRLVNTYVKHTNISVKCIEEFLKSDKWFDADGYLKEGFVDRVYDSSFRKLVKSLDTSKKSKTNTKPDK